MTDIIGLVDVLPFIATVSAVCSMLLALGDSSVLALMPAFIKKNG